MELSSHFQCEINVSVQIWVQEGKGHFYGELIKMQISFIRAIFEFFILYLFKHISQAQTLRNFSPQYKYPLC